jgi:hypothetical protein
LYFQRRLSWLAGKMKEHSQSIFLIEGLQPSWLGTKAKRAAYGTVVALSLGLLFGLLYGLYLRNAPIVGLSCGMILLGVGLGCWWESPLKNSVISGSIGGLSGGLVGGMIIGLLGGLIIGLIGVFGVGSLNHINLVETISWKWNQFWKRTIPGSIAGLSIGLIIFLFFGLPRKTGLQITTIDSLKMGLYLPLNLGLIGGVISGLVGGFTVSVKVGKASPNQGIKLSLKNLGCISHYLIERRVDRRADRVINGLAYSRTDLRSILELGLFGGLFAGLFGGLNRGGSAVIKHYGLRLILWLNGYTPFKFVKFLDHCARLILLKKVGGGYIFIHRMLLEYFAEMTLSRTEKIL